MNFFQRPERDLKPLALPLLTFFLCATVTFLVWQYAHGIIEELGRIKFVHETREAEGIIKRRLTLCLNELFNAKGFLEENPESGREAWTDYLQRTHLGERPPGLLVITFVERILEHERKNWVRGIREDKGFSPKGYPGFDIYPSGFRRQYGVVKFVEPLKGNIGLIGFDVFSDPLRVDALQKARDTGFAQATGAVASPLGFKGISLFEIYVPIYLKGAPIGSWMERRQALAGFVSATIDLGGFVSPGSLDWPLDKRIDFEIFDGGMMTVENLLFDQDGILRSSDLTYRPKFSSHSVVNLAGRVWSLRFLASREFLNANAPAWVPIVILILGLGTSSLIFGILYALNAWRSQALVLSEMGAIVESSHDAVIGVDLEGNVRSWNPAAERIYGFTSQEMIGQSLQKLMPLENQDEWETIVQRVRTEGRLSYYETNRLTKEGKHITVGLTVSPIKRMDGQIRGLSTIDRDLTQLKETGVLLEKFKDFYLTLLEEFPALIWRSQTDGSRDYFNKTWLSFTGRRLEEERGSGWEVHLHPEDRTRYLDRYRESIQSRESFEIEYRMKRQDGTYRWLMDYGIPFMGLDGEFEGFIGTSYDITDRKKIESDLRYSLDLLFSIIENIPDMIVLKDARELRYELFNKAGEDLLGVSRLELLGKNDTDLFERARAQKDIQRDFEILSEKKVRDIPEEVVATRLKGERILSTKKIPILSKENGDPLYLLTISEDITDRKKADAALRESEERLRAILNHSTALIYLKDTAGRYRLVNARFEALVSQKEKDLLGKSDFEIFPKETAEVFRSHDEKVLEKGSPIEFEETLRQSDGSHTYLSIRFPIRTIQGGIQGLCGILTDITERTRAEEQIRKANENLLQNERRLRNAFADLEKTHLELKNAQSQLIRAEKFAAIGKLSGIISHEIRNQLGVIRNSAFFIKMRIKTHDEKIKQHIRILEKETEETDRIIENILSFARKNRPELVPLDLKGLILNSLERVGRPSGIGLRTEIPDELPKIQGDPVLLNRVFVNLILNAYQAMQAGGSLEVRVQPQDGFVRIDFKDTGVGIEEEDKSKLFDPLFSTKTYGTGIGLAAAKVLVEAHGGSIDVQSQVGKGTVVSLRLPTLS